MKKFVFRLDPLRKVKITREKQKRAELAAAQTELQAIIREKEAHEKNLEETAEKYRCDIVDGLQVTDMMNYAVYFDFMRRLLEEVEVRLQQAIERKNKVLGELVALMKEIKTLDQLREQALIEYRAELRREEEKEIGDLLSFQITAEPAEGRY